MVAFREFATDLEVTESDTSDNANSTWSGLSLLITLTALGLKNFVAVRAPTRHTIDFVFVDAGKILILLLYNFFQAFIFINKARAIKALADY